MLDALIVFTLECPHDDHHEFQDLNGGKERDKDIICVFNTHNCVFHLGVHQESSVLVGDQGAVFAGENVRQTLTRSSSSLTGGEVGHQNFSNSIYDRTAISSLALDNSF